MAEVSESEVEAAVSAFMKKDQSETPLSQKSRRDDLPAFRRHHERFQSEFTKAGFDFSRLEKLYKDYKQEADRLLEKKTPPVEFETSEANQERQGVGGRRKSGSTN